MTSTPLPRGARIAGTVFAWTLGVLIVLAVVAAAWVGVRAYLAYGHLTAAQRTAAGATAVLSDPSSAATLIDGLSSDTRAARELTSDPVWRLAETAPWIGPQLAAVSTVAAAIDDVASDALEPLAAVAAGFSPDSIRPVDGRIDLAPISALSGAASTGAEGVDRAARSIDAIDAAPLLGPVKNAVAEVDELMSTASATTDALARATALLPAMLGADGPRDYLIVFQNNAEWRSLGGIVGAMALVHTDDGSITLVDQRSSSTSFNNYARDGILPLDPEVESIFGIRPARWVHNVTQVPDFSISGPLAQAFWERETGVEVDGVIAMDPVALSYLLEATGPVELATGDVLTSDNAVQLLLNEVYVRYEEPVAQDAFFAAATVGVFEALVSGDVDPGTLVSSLGRAGDERRLLLWSAIEEDQALLVDTTLVGPLPVTDEDQVGFGVYLNDGTGSKMDYYVDTKTTLDWSSCSLDRAERASGELTLTVSLSNDAPADAATSLPPHITGMTGRETVGGVASDDATTIGGVAPGDAKTIGYVYLPEGFELRSAERSDDAGFGGGFHDGRQVLTFSSTLSPGESVTATFVVRSTTPGAAQAIAWTTPTVDADQPTAVGALCDVP